MRFDDMTSYGTVSLGGLIDALKRRDQTHIVSLGFEHMVPTSLESYRGFYDHLALGFADHSDWPKVAHLVDMLEKAVGESFCGWKGGDYTMDRETPVWVANPGNTGSTAIVGIADCTFMTILQTEWVDI